MTWAIFQYAMVLAGPWMFLLYAFHAGLLTIWDLVAHQRRLGDVFRYSTWRDEMFARCFERVAPAVAESMDKSALPALAQQAQGVVMDIGPGSGEQLRRFDVSKITRIYGVEPNESLFPALRDNIKKAGLESVYTIVPSGIENKDKLEEYGIVENSMDTVVTIHVLCSVPQPQEMVSALYRYLRPGGQLIYFEHVRNTTFPASLVQEVLMIIWPAVLGNCHINRPTYKWLAEAGRWSKMEVSSLGLDSRIDALPHVFGRLFK